MPTHLTPLERQRLIVGKTQAEVAHLARLSQPAIGRYETGEAKPRPSKIADYAAALRLDPAALVDLIDATLAHCHAQRFPSPAFPVARQAPGAG